MALKSKQNKLDENEAPLQVEVVTEETTSTDVAVVKQTGSIQNFNVDDALAQWEAYQIFTEKLLVLSCPKSSRFLPPMNPVAGATQLFFFTHPFSLSKT